MPNGYYGKIARVDLTTGTSRMEPLSEGDCRLFLGGSGLAAKIIADEVPPAADPLGPGNKLVFATGPLNMINIPGAGRWEVCAISPKTGRWGEANGGGKFGRKLKQSGFDVLIVEGRSEKPVLVELTDDRIRIVDAGAYWGKDSMEAAEKIEADFGRDYSILTIGQAGEKMVPIAGIIADSGHGHAGRTGMGAIMGSKNLKAVIAKGDKKSEVSDPEKVEALIKKTISTIRNSAFYPDFHKHGQPGAIVPREAEGLLPMKNWQIGSWPEGAKKIGAPFYTEELNVKNHGCAFCPVACKRLVSVKDGKGLDHSGPGAEYETLAMMGSNLLIDDLKKISYANDLCNRYGIDTMSAGAIIAMVFELYEKGILDKKFLDGIEAKWGDADAMIALVKKIGANEGCGKELGRGVRRLKEIFGEAAAEAGPEVLGMEVPGHDPRAYFSMAVTYCTSTRGACHLHGFSEAMELGSLNPEIGISETVDRASEHQKGRTAAVYADLAALHNSMIWCMVLQFADIGYAMQTEIVNAVTGWNLGYADFIKIGERINTLQHMINLGRGLKRTDMKLPKRFLTALNEGGAAGKVPDVEKMVEDFLAYRKWNGDAVPSREKLVELGLEKYA
jgi:aldehyde:ferredoxin oxidoreductase